MRDLVEHRALAALLFLDAASGRCIGRSLRVRADGARIVRNQSGAYVVTHVDGPLAAIATSFREQPIVAPQQVAFTVGDPLGQYVPRRFKLELPRERDPKARDEPTSLFKPHEVPMYPSPSARWSGNWASWRVSLSRTVAEAQRFVRGAVVRVVQKSDGKLLGVGVSERVPDGDDAEWGEALVCLPGLPLMTFAADAAASVTTLTTAARGEVFFDPAAPWPVDPDAVLADVQLRRAIHDDLAFATGGASEWSTHLSV